MRDGGVEGCVEHCKWLSTFHKKFHLVARKSSGKFITEENQQKHTKKKQVFRNSFDGLSAALQSLGRKSAGVGTYT